MANIANKTSELGVDTIIFDADNTLFRTFNLFEERTEEYCKWLSEISSVPAELIKDTMDDLWEKEWPVGNGETIRMPDVFCVDPLSLRELARLAALMHNVTYYNKRAQKALEDLMTIYHTAPQPIPGAYESLILLRDAGMKIVIATHSEDE